MDQYTINKLENVFMLNNQLIHIKNIINNITIEQIEYTIYDMNVQTEYAILKSNYENPINNMMIGCFGGGPYQITQGKHNNGFWILAKLENELVAVIMVNFRKNGPWIWNVCRNTLPKYNGYGIGESLIKYALNHLQNKYSKHKKIYLYASQIPVSRTKFYESLGFVLTSKFASDGITPRMVFNQI